MADFAKEVLPVNLEDEMKQSYLDYAMSVIVGRALPDVRDGLKPVHRRALYAMSELGNDWNKPYKKSARIVGDCFVKGTLVHTETGLLPIEAVEPGCRVQLPDGRLSEVVQAFANPPGKVVQVKLSNGYTFTVTPGQLFRVLRDDLSVVWEKAERLAGQRVLVASAASLGGVEAHPDPQQNALAYVLGLLVAEGYLTDRGRSRRVAINMVEREPLEFLYEFCAERGYAVRWREVAPQQPHYQMQHCVRVTGWDDAYEVCENTCQHKQVPHLILADRRLFAPFLAGFTDGDGHLRVKKSQREATLVSTSPTLLTQIQAMLADSGIHACLTCEDFSTRTYGQNWLPRYHLWITGSHAARFGAMLHPYLRISAKKAAALTLLEWEGRVLNTTSECIPGGLIFAELSRHHLGGGWYKAEDGSKFRAGIRYPSGSKIRYDAELHERDISFRQIDEWGVLNKLERIGSPLAGSLRHLLATYNVLYVEDVQDKGETAATYDVQIADASHEFLVQGCAVHNCIGKYHPHGDTAVYDTIVRMAQGFSMRYPLVDGQGNFGCFTGDTRIKLADGSEKSFAELAELPPDTVFYVYAVDRTGKIVIAPGRYSRITRPQAQLLELTLDNGATVRCTPDHLFMLRDGSYKQAQELTPEDSLMPGYFDSTPVKPGLNDYLRIFQPALGKYQFVHQLADEFNAERGLVPEFSGPFVRHHRNFNRWDNTPSNIQRLTFLEHLHLHAAQIAELWDDPAFRAAQRQGVKNYYAENPQVVQERGQRFTAQNRDEQFRQQNGPRIARALCRYHAEHPQAREDISTRMRALWQDPEYREKMSEALSGLEKRSLTTEEKARVAQIIAEKSRAMWSDEAKREEIVAAICRALNSQEVRAKISRAVRRNWKNPAYRAKFPATHFSHMAQSAWAKSTTRDLHREKINHQRQSPVFRSAHKQGVQQSNNRRLQENPPMMAELNHKAVAALRVQWQTSEYPQQVMRRKIAGYVHGLLQTVSEQELTPDLYESCRHQNWIPRIHRAVGYFGSFAELLAAGKNYNHRIIAKRPLTEIADTYDITVDEHHNFLLACGVFVHNSIDGDAPAAMRYTEVRMSRIAHELLADIDKETVDFVPNYDESEREPAVFPTRIPNLLVNGSSGIAVGMATNIPPHSLREVINACIALIDKPDLTTDELVAYVPGPDFPTAGIISGVRGIREAYRTGRGRVYVRARTQVETDEARNRQAIIVTELPYQVNKARLLEKIAELVKEKKLEGISDLRDESDKDGMRIYIELRRNEVPDVVLNNLYQHTQMQSVFSINMVALVDGQPRVLGLKPLLEAFLRHRREVVTRRTLYELRKAREKAHILEGLAVALASIDAMIDLIKRSGSPAEARDAMLAQAWAAGVVTQMLTRAGAELSRPEDLAQGYGLHDDGYRLSPIQAQAILDLRLHRLTGLEQDKIVADYKVLLDEIEGYLAILTDPDRLLAVIRAELCIIGEQYGDVRRTEIIVDHQDLTLEDLISEEDMVVTLSHAGYVKAQPAADYRAQRRGGRGKAAASVKEEDFIDKLFVANTHDTLLCFSNRGQVYWKKVYELPQASRISRGRPIVNLLPLDDGERINAVLPVREFTDDHYVFFATTAGTVKKTPLSEYSRPRPSGIIAIDLHDGDQLVNVAITDGSRDIMLFSDAGKAIRFPESEVRPMGRNAGGVRGMRLNDGQKVIALIVVAEGTVLTVTENGYGKRTPADDYPCHGRGGQGVISIQTTERNGNVTGAVQVNGQHEIMLVTNAGTLIRTRVEEISTLGRNTQGVKLISVQSEERLIGIERIEAMPENDNDNDDEAVETEGDWQEGGE